MFMKRRHIKCFFFVEEKVAQTLLASTANHYLPRRGDNIVVVNDTQ